MDNPKSRSDRDWKPDVDDDNDYVYRDGYWHVYYDEHDELIAEEEDAAERSYLRSQKRAEWEHYHSGEPCPKCELEQEFIIKAEDFKPERGKWYVVWTNGQEWRDRPIHMYPAPLLEHHLRPEIIRGRPLWVAEVTDPTAAQKDLTSSLF